MKEHKADEKDKDMDQPNHCYFAFHFSFFPFDFLGISIIKSAYIAEVVRTIWVFIT